jgi:hypothetical protein
MSVGIILHKVEGQLGLAFVITFIVGTILLVLLLLLQLCIRLPRLMDAYTAIFVVFNLASVFIYNNMFKSVDSEGLV